MQSPSSQTKKNLNCKTAQFALSVISAQTWLAVNCDGLATKRPSGPKKASQYYRHMPLLCRSELFTLASSVYCGQQVLPALLSSEPASPRQLSTFKFFTKTNQNCRKTEITNSRHAERVACLGPYAWHHALLVQSYLSNKYATNNLI